MHSLATSTLAWVGFCSFILVMLAIDLGVFNRKPHEITTRNAAVWSGVWITLALIFAGTALINRVHAIIYIFGVFLVYTGIKMLGGDDDESNPEASPIVRFVTRH